MRSLTRTFVLAVALSLGLGVAPALAFGQAPRDPDPAGSQSEGESEGESEAQGQGQSEVPPVPEEYVRPGPWYVGRLGVTYSGITIDDDDWLGWAVLDGLLIDDLITIDVSEDELRAPRNPGGEPGPEIVLALRAIIETLESQELSVVARVRIEFLQASTGTDGEIPVLDSSIVRIRVTRPITRDRVDDVGSALFDDADLMRANADVRAQIAAAIAKNPYGRARRQVLLPGDSQVLSRPLVAVSRAPGTGAVPRSALGLDASFDLFRAGDIATPLARARVRAITGGETLDDPALGALDIVLGDLGVDVRESDLFAIAVDDVGVSLGARLGFAFIDQRAFTLGGTTITPERTTAFTVGLEAQFSLSRLLGVSELWTSAAFRITSTPETRALSAEWSLGWTHVSGAWSFAPAVSLGLHHERFTASGLAPAFGAGTTAVHRTGAAFGVRVLGAWLVDRGVEVLIGFAYREVFALARWEGDRQRASLAGLDVDLSGISVTIGVRVRF